MHKSGSWRVMAGHGKEQFRSFFAHAAKASTGGSGLHPAWK